jgi:hypothetical protein
MSAMKSIMMGTLRGSPNPPALAPVGEADLRSIRGRAKLRWLARIASCVALILLSTGAAAWADQGFYEIQKTEPKVTAGDKGKASLTIATKNGWHVNAEAPITVALTAPAGINVPKPKLSRSDLAASSTESARFDIPFEATEAGQKVIACEAKFVICQESACKPVKETLALNIDVAPPAAAKPSKAKGKTKAK